MISVLKSWNEIGAAVQQLTRRGLPRHATTEKNWDHWKLISEMESLDRSAAIVDLGCGNLFALKMLRVAGFSNLLGVEKTFSLRTVASSLRDKWIRRHPAPIRLLRANIEALPLRDQSVDVCICISVIEHGVDLDRFFHEVARITRPGGRLFLTFDYWERSLPSNPAFKVYGLPWHVFSKDDVKEFLSMANSAGFKETSSEVDLSCSGPCVFWGGQEFTFMCCVFERT
jgi:SAM-dependent methyltransferase